MSDGKKGYRKYDEIARNVCNLKNFDNFFALKTEELDGYLGVCIVLAFIDGTEPTLVDMSKGLGVNHYLLDKPFNRLKANYVFSEEFDVKNDTVLLGKKRLIHNQLLGDRHQTELAWCNIAGIASGLVGLRNEEDIYKFA